MRVLLHIGQSKTGSSAIQSFLTINSSRLRKFGIVYPMPHKYGMTIDIASHNAVADSLLGVKRYPNLTSETYFLQFYSECERSGADLLILSGEHFWAGEPRLSETRDTDEYWALYKKKVRTLASYLSGHSVSVIVYLRPQVDWFSSTVAHEIMFLQSSAMSSGKKDWFIDNFYDSDAGYFEKYKDLLLYAKRLDVWNDLISPHSIIVVPYVRDRLLNKSSIADFAHRTGLSQIENLNYAIPSEVNRSISMEFVEVKKILNKTPKSLNGEQSILECISQLSQKRSMGLAYKLQDHVAEMVEEYVAADNARLSTEYIRDGKSFVARAAYEGDMLEAPTELDVARAMARFEQEYRRLGFRLRALRHGSMKFIRRRAGTLHVVLHQFKRLKRRVKYG